MDLHSIRQSLRTKSIYDLPLRVTYYARVSSESGEQLNSLGNQITYYEDFIRKNPAWEFVEGYIDEGLSAATTKNRENFHRMVEDGGRLAIDEGEVPMVRELFELYASGEYSMKQIETLFWDKGYRNHNGKKIAHTTMSGMISNPKYKGYYVGNKVKVVDLFTKKQKFLPPEEWVMFKDETGEIVPAIVDETLWEQANKVLQKRSEDVKGRQGICNHANLLTGKLFCTDCGTAYYRRDSVDKTGKKNSKWVCSGKIKNGADSCASFPIYEEELKPLLFEVFQETEADADALIEEYIEMYKSLGDGEDTAKQIAALRQQIELAQKKKSKLLGYNAAGQLSDRDFLSMNKECDREMDEAERQIYELEQQQLSKAEFKKHIDTIRRVLREAKRDAAQGIINKEFVDRYIDKIFVTPEDGRLKLQIKIFTGDTTDKYLTNLKRRTGHTFNDEFEQSVPLEVSFVPMMHPTEEGRIFVAEKSTFNSLADFLRTEFYRGLALGNAPRQCHNCGRYFLLTAGYNTCYCNNIVPGELERTCRKAGAHRKEAWEKRTTLRPGRSMTGPTTV